MIDLASASLVDLGSDTATRPTAAMKRAMSEALLGDEQKGEDPTTTALEERTAALLGFERALFVPSATLANQIALALHAGAGDEIIAHKTAHVVHYEGGGTTMTSRAQLYGLDTPRGIFSAGDVEAAIRADDPHHPRTACVVVENTSNVGGGAVWPLQTLDGVYDLCRERGIAVHVDGARLWNAATALNVPLRRLTRPSADRGATTVQVCFSKGLGCPFGAVLALPASSWPRARRLKQSLGGALRQSGVVTGALLHALDHHLERLVDDHRRATMLATGLAAIPGVAVEPVESNLVFFSTNQPVAAVVAACAARGVRIGSVARTVSPGRERLRACLHLDVDDAGVAAAIAAVRAALAS